MKSEVNGSMGDRSVDIEIELDLNFLLENRHIEFVLTINFEQNFLLLNGGTHTK